MIPAKSNRGLGTYAWSRNGTHSYTQMSLYIGCTLMQSMSDGWQITLRPRPDTRIWVFLKLEIVNSWRFLKSPAFCLRVDGRKQWSHTSSVLLQSWTKHMENWDPPPPPPISPGSKMIKWRVLASARLQPWFFWGVGVCCSIFFCPRLLHSPHPVRDAIILPSIALPLLYRFIWMGKNNSNTLRVDVYLKRGWESEPGGGRFSEK